MADSQLLGTGTVKVVADMSPLDRDLDSLPAKVLRRAAEARQRLSAELSKVRLDLDVGRAGVAAGGGAAQLRDVARLEAAESLLEYKIEACDGAIARQVGLLKQQAAAASAAANATRGAAGAAGKAGAAIGGLNSSSKYGAMGILALGQAIDDAQYGFRAVVNQIPQLGMALAGAFGKSPEAAMKFAGALGIAGVAVNQFIQHWDDFKEAFRGDDFLAKAVRQMDRLGEALHRELHAEVDLVFGTGTRDAAGSMATRDLMDRAKAAKEEDAQRAEKATERVGGLRSKADRTRGQAVEDAIAESGMGPGLAERLHTRALARRGGKFTGEGAAEKDAELRKQIGLMLDSALKGQRPNIDAIADLMGGDLGKKLRDVDGAVDAERQKKAEQRMAKETEEAIRNDDEMAAYDAERQRKAEQRLARETEEAIRNDDEMAAYEKSLQMKALARDKEARARVVEEDAARMKAAAEAPRAEFKGVDSYLKDIQVGAFREADDVPLRQLKVLENIEKALKDDRPAAAGAIFG